MLGKKIVGVLFLLQLFGCQSFVNTAPGGSLVANTIGSSTLTNVTFTAPTGTGYSTVNVDLGSAFLAQNISSGVTIFGLAGTAPVMLSNACRNMGVTEISQLAEVTTYAGTTGINLPTGYREVASIASDDEGGYFTGYCASNVAVTNQTDCLALGGTLQWVGNSFCIDLTNNTQALCVGPNEVWTTGASPCNNTGVDADQCSSGIAISSTVHNAYVDCGGNGFTSIALAVADCATQNGPAATWNGQLLGIHGESTWVMVAHRGGASSNQEVWQDQKTQLIWSSKATTTAAWCAAVGNNTDTLGADPCNTENAAGVSYCQEVSGLTPGFTGDTGGLWGSGPLTYDNAKGAMGQTSTLAVRWRLPTKFDALSAELDGIRNVMPDMGSFASGPQEWLATALSNDRLSAWYLSADKGATSTAVRTTTYNVRCVGR